MEIRTLRYFLEAAREQSISRAADKVHVTQPALSKQIRELETELGRKLFVRSSHSVRLTDEGMLLRKRAEDILSLVDKTLEEFRSLPEITGGTVYIGCAESRLISVIAGIIREFRESYPDFVFRISSGGADDTVDMLDRGLLDLAVIVEPPNLAHYSYLEIPGFDSWGLIVRRDSPLAAKEFITPDDLIGLDLICPERAIRKDIPRWCGEKAEKFRYVGSVNLAYNASVFVREGLGCQLTFGGIVDVSGESGLKFIPLRPRLTNSLYVIWRKFQVFTPIAGLFVERLKERLGKSADAGEPLNEGSES